jgi:hypothetical protein
MKNKSSRKSSWRFDNHETVPQRSFFALLVALGLVACDGDYQPLNCHGLVLANPEEQPFQAYSHDVLPVNFGDADRYFVTSFVD